MKITLTILTFCLSRAFAIELKETNVALPLGVPQLDTSALKKGQSEIKYTVKLFQNKDGDVIRPRISDNKSIDEFMSTLIYSYKNQDEDLFKILINKKALKNFDTNSDKFKDSFKYLQKIKKPHLKYVFEYNDGYIVSWSAIGLSSNRIIYLEKNSKFEMHKLDIKEDDHLFWNMGLYFKYAPFDSYTPKKVVAKKLDDKYKITLKVHELRNWVHIYSSKDRKIDVISVSDNYPNNKQHKDWDLNSKSMELMISSKELKQIGEDLRIVETSFPISEVTEAVHKKSTKLNLKN